MPQVVALYRYPVKGLTPESRPSLSIGVDGRVLGDRVLGFRFADAGGPDDEWSTKREMLTLVNTHGLAGLGVRFDAEARHLVIDVDGRRLVEGGLDPDSRTRICAAVAAYANDLPMSGVHDQPGRLPDLDEARFRSNVVVDGVDAWAELG